MKGKVLDGKILVKQDNPEEVTKGGIIIPDTLKEKPKQGEIIILGNPVNGVNKQMEVGDKVLFSDHAGTSIELKDGDLSLEGEYVLLDQTQVLFIKTKN